MSSQRRRRKGYPTCIWPEARIPSCSPPRREAYPGKVPTPDSKNGRLWTSGTRSFQGKSKLTKQWRIFYRPSQQATKNLSKEYVVKHKEVSLQELLNRGIPGNNLGGSFSRNRKEKAYHLTNSSSITSLNSYKSLDMPDKKECREFPTTKGNQSLKRAMNQSQVFEQTVLNIP